MADKGMDVKGKGGETSGETSTKKLGSVIPKDRKHVSQMMGEKISEAISSGVKSIVKNKNKNKINPDGGGLCDIDLESYI
ncbi:hypothetical protein ACH5RR_026458 [Cinchona calisaya]|uniref:Uncharacterized protein n=1 Tax=Cinchona calisaya TaxID=153742 RepID=A0ABD2Z2M4_9GENT